MKNDDNDNIAPTVSECRSDIAPAHQPAADDKQRRLQDDSKNASAAACPVTNNTLQSTTNNTNGSDDADEEDSDEEIGAMIYASSNTTKARRAAAEPAMNDSNQPSSSYEPGSEVRKRKSLSNSSSNSKEMKSAPKKKRVNKSFEQRIEDLRAYKAKHGHVNVKKRDDKSLHRFCVGIRHARIRPEKSNMVLTEIRIASLDALGFEWNSGTKSFEQRIVDLQAFKEKHGHVNVKRSEDKSLYNFCNNIRYARNNPGKSKMALSDDRIASLDALGFDWTVKEQVGKSFERRMEQLRLYKEKHGHINVKQGEDKSLYGFCIHMRHARNNPKKYKMVINEERITSLDALGFDWAVTERRLATMAKGAASSSDPTPIHVPSLCMSNDAYYKDTDDEDDGLRNNEAKEHPVKKEYGEEYELDTDDDDESGDKKLAGNESRPSTRSMIKNRGPVVKREM